MAVYGFTAELAQRLAGSIRTDESDTGGIGGTLAGAAACAVWPRGSSPQSLCACDSALRGGCQQAFCDAALGQGFAGLRAAAALIGPRPPRFPLPGNALSMAAMRATLEHVLTEEAFRQVPASFPPPDGCARSTALTRSRQRDQPAWAACPRRGLWPAL